jgi:AcrR family transcriptional regulator
MGVQERKARHKKALREQILDAAREVFAKEGYESVSMRRIAEEIEYSPTTIYLYFKDKAELMHCLCEETFARLASIVERIVDEEPDPVVRLKRGMRAYVEFGLKNPDHYKVTFLIESEQIENPTEHHTQHKMGMKVYNFLKSAIQNCIAARKFRDMDLETATQSLWAAIHGVTALLITDPQFPWVDRDQLIDSVIDTMTAGFAA